MLMRKGYAGWLVAGASGIKTVDTTGLYIYVVSADLRDIKNKNTIKKYSTAQKTDDR